MIVCSTSLTTADIDRHPHRRMRVPTELESTGGSPTWRIWAAKTTLPPQPVDVLGDAVEIVAPVQLFLRNGG